MVSGGRAEAHGRVGAAAAVGSAFSFAVTIVVNRSLAQSDLGVATSLGARFAIAGLVLLGILAVRRGPMLPAPGERVRVFLLGAVGYASEATIFFLALRRGSAAAVSLLFYTYPAMVTITELVTGTERPQRSTFAALGLSAAGSVLVIVAGADVSITTAGIALALTSAAAVTAFFIASDRLVTKSDSLTTGAWMAVGAATSFLVAAAVGGGLRDPAGYTAHLAGNGVATASAFVLLFLGLRLLGATRTSVVLTLEAFFAIVLAAVFLDEGIRPLQAVGGTAILAATAVIALRKNAAPAGVEVGP